MYIEGFYNIVDVFRALAAKLLLNYDSNPRYGEVDETWANNKSLDMTLAMAGIHFGFFVMVAGH